MKKDECSPQEHHHPESIQPRCTISHFHPAFLWVTMRILPPKVRPALRTEGLARPRLSARNHCSSTVPSTHFAEAVDDAAHDLSLCSAALRYRLSGVHPKRLTDILRRMKSVSGLRRMFQRFDCHHAIHPVCNLRGTPTSCYGMLRDRFQIAWGLSRCCIHRSGSSFPLGVYSKYWKVIFSFLDGVVDGIHIVVDAHSPARVPPV